MVPSSAHVGTYSARFVAWMSRADSCPSCVLNTEPPRHVRPTETGFTAHYRCSDCRHEWNTSWMDE